MSKSTKTDQAPAKQVAANIESFLDSKFYFEWRKGRAMRDPARQLRFLQNRQTKADIFDDLSLAINDAFRLKVLNQLATDQMLHYVQAMTLVASRDGTLNQVFPVPGAPADKPAET